MAVDKDTVRLAYQLLLGREPESEDVVDDVCKAFDNISDLRNHFMLCEEFQYTQRFMRFAEQAYNDDQDVRAKTLEFETFLSLGGQTEAGISHLIQSVIEDPKASPAEKEYSFFHRRRFFDTIRAVIAIRHKSLSKHSRIRVLEVGTAPFTPHYGEVVRDMDFFTANITTLEPADAVAVRSKSLGHYHIDFESEDISVKYPELVTNPFHIILFCEVIEHVRAGPDELIADLLRITASDGIIVVSTPNALNREHLWEYFAGRKPDQVFSKSKRFLYIDHHAHVREYTLKELEAAVLAANGRVVLEGVSDYYDGMMNDIVQARFVSARNVATLLVGHKNATVPPAINLATD